MYELILSRLQTLQPQHRGMDWLNLSHRNLLMAGFYDMMLEELQTKEPKLPNNIIIR